MRRSGWWVAGVCALASVGTSGCEAKPEGSAEVRSGGVPDLLTDLLEYERSFERAARSDGVTSAFQAFVADDGIIFRPGPVEAGPWLRENGSGLQALQWVPVAAALASSGDLGYTTGPYVATEEGGQERQGHYLSIWQATEDGGFQVVFDIGTPTPDAGPLPESPKVIADHIAEGTAPLPGAPGPSGPKPFEGLKEVDRGYAVEQATEGSVSALSLYAAASVRIHRPGRFPLVGAATAEIRQALGGERFSTSPVDGRLSTSGTLGYVYGSVAMSGKSEAGNYVRIWRRDPGASWTLALELIDVLHE